MAPKKGDLSESEKKVFEAVTNGDIVVVQNLLKEKDVCVDCLDSTGMTPLQQAAYRGNSEMCKLFLSNGADVNSLYHDSSYTTLMFAALSGDLKTTQLVLEHGAKTDVTNSIGRTASQMAAFVGQHHCVSLINNFFSKEDLDYYTQPTGVETEAKLPVHKAQNVYKLILNNNMKTVKIAFMLQENPELLEDPKIYRLFETLCEKVMKQKETNEVMAMKFHYYHCILKHCYENKDIDAWIKVLLKGNAANFEEGQEKFIRTVFRHFPYIENQLIQQIVRQLHQVQIGDSPTALDVLDQAINGQRMPKDTDMPCTTCGDFGAVKKCTKCRYANYCDQKCQKIHWFTHKKWCAKLAEYQKQIDEQKKLEEEQEKLEQQKQEEKRLAQSETDNTNSDPGSKEETTSRNSEESGDGMSSGVSQESSSQANSHSSSNGTTGGADGGEEENGGIYVPDPDNMPTEDVSELVRRGNVFLKKKQHQKAIHSFQKAIELDSSCTEAINGYRSAFMEDLADSDDIRRRAENSPEIQEMLAKPDLRKKLEEMKNDPDKLREYLQDPEMAKNIERLMECSLQD